MRRFLKISGLTLGSLVAVLLVTIAFFVATETGTRLVLTRALPESVTVRSVDGRLIGPLALHGLRLDTPSLAVGIEHAELRWRPRDLISGSFHIDRLRADGVSVTSLPTEPGPPPDDGPVRLPSEISAPVSIRVHELLVNDIAYRASPQASPLVIDAVRASLGAAGTRFDLERLGVAAPLFDVEVEATLTAEGEYPLAADIELALRPEGYATVQSAVRITGSLQSLRVVQTVGPPYNLHADARIFEPLDQLRIDVGVELSEVDPAAISASLPQAMLGARVHAEGTLSDLSLQTTATGTYLGERLHAELDAALQSEQLRVDTLTLALPEHDARVGGSGTIRLSGDFATEASLAWQNLAWPLGNAPEWRSEEGEVAVSGSLDDYVVSTHAAVTLPGGFPMQAQANGRGNREQVNADLGLSLLEGSIEGNVAASWQPSLRAHVALEGDDVNPAALSPDWPGRLDFGLRASAEAGDRQTRARLEELTASGMLRDQPVEVDGRGGYENGEIIVDRLRAELGATRLTAAGRYADTADLAWELESDDLGELLPAASGTITSRGNLRGTPPQVRIDASLDASGLAYRDNRIETVELVADVDLTDREASRVDLRIEGIETAAVSGDVVALQADGRLAGHRASLMAETTQGSVDLEVDARLNEPWSGRPTWDFTLTGANVAYPELRPWRLEGVAEGSASAARMALERHCWASGPSRLCLEGRRTPQDLSLGFSLEELRFGYFASLLPPGVALDGTLSGRGEVARTTGGPLRADVLLQTGSGRLAVDVAPPDGPDETDRPARNLLDLKPSRLSLTLDEDRANAAVDLDFAQGRIELQADLTPSAAPLMQRSLDGRLLADVPDLSFIAPFTPDIENLTGKVAGRLEFAGTPGNPDFSGQIALTDAALTSTAAGIRLEDIEAALEGRAEDGIGLDASMRSGGGTLEIDGDLAFGQPPARTTIEIDGKDFQLLGTEEARVFVSPDLEVVADGEAVRVTGVVQVPRADITPQTVPESAVKASEDVVLVSPETGAGDSGAAGRPVHAEVQIVLGDEVRFEGFGLEARFEGETTVVQEPGEPTSATGAITIAEGEYRAYGQGLVIESGKILFAGGPVTEPALDVRAVRRPEEGILVGSHVRGTLEEPEFSLFSEPPMTQQEQLSYLVLGRSLEEAPEGESSALARASLALGVKGGNFLAENIGKNLGVDEFSIQTGSGEAGAASDPADAALVIGKYLSPKLYLSYGIGIFNPESVLSMEYEINRRLQLVTESSSESTGADLVYSFERGD